MTSPSAAHTGIVPAEQVVAEAIAQGRVRPRPTVDYGTNAAPSHQAMAALAETSAQLLVDSGDASWCPTCGGVGTLPRYDGTPGLSPPTGRTLCTRCRGGRLNPFHGCTFHTDPPCTCTHRCQVYQPQETPTP